MYGGAAGGGKSAALLMCALQYVEFAKYSALLLRRTFSDLNLPEALIPLSHSWLRGTDAKWDGSKHEWRFPSGATLTFGFLETENDKYRYQGAAFNFIGFDELTQFSESQYRYLFSRMRRKEGSVIPTRMRSASNPGGVGHEWVRQRFIDSVDGRLFVPARLEDNPYLDRASYEESLNRLDPVTRAQLRHGDWRIRPEGNLFKREWFKDVVELAPPLTRTVRAWDMAATAESEGNDPDWTVGAKIGLDDNNIAYLVDLIRFRATPLEVENVIKATARIDGDSTSIRLEQEPGSSGKSLVDHYCREVLFGYDVKGVPATGDKVTRARPFSAACERRGVKLVRGNWIPAFLDELTSFPTDGAHDDQVDAAVNAFAALSSVVEFNSGFYSITAATAA